MSPNASVTGHVEQERAPHVTSRLSGTTARRYLAVILIFPFLGMLLPFVLESVPALKPITVSRYGSMLDYSYNISQENADVLLFGDSSALYGVDTRLLSSQLSLKVINLPGTLGSLPITGDLPLRHYLSHNKAPRLIVFYVPPWGLDVMNSHNRFFYEGTEQIIRHGTVADILEMARTRPETVLSFPMHYYLINNKLASRLIRKPFREPQLIMGHSPNPERRKLSGDCVFPDRLKLQSDPASIQRLLTKFSSPATKTMVYLAPIPNCLGYEDIAATQHSGISVAAPKVLPAEDFSEDPFLIHPLADKTDLTTAILGDAVRKALSH